MRLCPIRKKFAIIFCGLSLLLGLNPLSESLVAQTEATPCTQETLDSCYAQALELYRDKNYEAAQSLLEQVIAIDVGYKKTSSYLKKCYDNIAKQKLAQQKEAQRLAETRKKQEELEAKKIEEERLKAEREALKTQKAEEEFFAKQKDEMEEIGRTPPEMEMPPPEAVYRIDVGDILAISVWRNDDLDKSVIVRPDGVISYPLVGDLPAAGLTLVELDNQLTQALTEFIRNPVVSVAVESFGGVKVIALGEVGGQGILSLPGGGTVIDVIALAGGFTRDAVRRSTFLIRGGVKNPEVYRLNLARIFKGDLSQNIAIQSNDIIYVPKKFIAHFNEAIARVTPLLSNMLLGTSVGRDLGILNQ